MLALRRFTSLALAPFSVAAAAMEHMSRKLLPCCTIVRTASQATVVMGKIHFVVALLYHEDFCESAFKKKKHARAATQPEFPSFLLFIFQSHCFCNACSFAMASSITRQALTKAIRGVSA